MDKTPAHANHPRILVIRRDNIGDLVCTTPLFSTLRQSFPTGYIAALVNTYSAPVLQNNPVIDKVFSYTKGKHGANDQGVLKRWLGSLNLIKELRQCRFDIVIAITPSAVSLAKLLAPKRIISAGVSAGVDVVALEGINELHAVEAVHHYLSRLGIHSPPGPLSIFPDTTGKADSHTTPTQSRPIIGLHLSARKPSQRWPVESFAALAARLHAQCGASFRVFWSPGAQDNPLHPGDDEKAAWFQSAAEKLPVQLCPSNHLSELIAAMSSCDMVICGDGGAMHIAAGLGKPVVALFGDSPPQRWRPWGVAHQVLQPPSRNVGDLTVDEVFQASLALLGAAVPGFATQAIDAQ